MTTTTIQFSKFHKTLQNLNVNWTPRSETVFVGTLWSLAISLAKIHAVSMADGVFFRGKKSAIFDIQSQQKWMYKPHMVEVPL